MKKNIPAIVPVITLLFYCCTYGTELNRSLESAGSNRAELEAVLSHYRTADPNPYKLRAAEYLIENLPAHYSYAGTKIYDYYGYAARILADTALTPEQQRDSLLTITDSKYSDLPLHTIPDAEIITAVLDETPVGSRYTAATRWFVILSDRGMEETSEWDLSTMIGGGFFPYERGPKVYRNSYAINKERQRYMERSRYRYPFELGKKDVTKQYFLTSDLQLPIDRAARRQLRDKYVYIASAVRVDDNADQTSAGSRPEPYGWQIVDLGVIKCGKACFRDMGREVLYMALGYDGDKLIPISSSFILHKDGAIEYISSDTINSPLLDRWKNNAL